MIHAGVEAGPGKYVISNMNIAPHPFVFVTTWSYIGFGKKPQRQPTMSNIYVKVPALPWIRVCAPTTNLVLRETIVEKIMFTIVSGRRVYSFRENCTLKKLRNIFSYKVVVADQKWGEEYYNPYCCGPRQSAMKEL